MENQINHSKESKVFNENNCVSQHNVLSVNNCVSDSINTCTSKLCKLIVVLLS